MSGRQNYGSAVDRLVVAESTHDADQSHLARRSFCSWEQTGWRSLLVRSVVTHREVDHVTNPAVDDQLIVLIQSGIRTVETSRGAHSRRSRLVPGRLAMTAPGTPSQLTWRTTSSELQGALHVHLPGSLMRATAAELWDRDSSTAAMPDALSVTDPLLEQVVRSAEAAARGGASELYAEAVAHLLAVHLLTRHGRLGPPPEVGRGGDDSVRRALEFIHDSVDRRITVAEVAAAANLSPFHFLRKFADAVGEPPYSYLVRLRVNRATRLLTTTNVPLTDISRQCGFTSDAAMRAAFKRLTGAPPIAVRRGTARPHDPGSELA